MGIEPINGGFANHCLTGWLPRRTRWRLGEGLLAGRVVSSFGLREMRWQEEIC